MNETKMIMVVLSGALFLAGPVAACGGGGKGVKSGSFASGSKGGGSKFPVAQAYSPSRPANAFAGIQQQIAGIRQVAAIKASIRRAQMMPMRIAKAQQRREITLAGRERRRVQLIAKMEQRRRETEFQESQEMIAGLRSWTDRTGAYTTEAKLVAYNGDTIRLRKADETEVTVSIHKLSHQDQAWLDNEYSNLSPGVMLAMR